MVVLAACCMAAGTAAYMLWSGEHEPNSQEESLSQLLKLYRAGPSGSYNKVVDDGIRQFGTNAIPYFLTWIQYDEPRVESVTRNWIEQKTAPFGPSFSRVDRANQAAKAFRALGEDADYAIGDLARLANRGDSGAVRSRAVIALVLMGRPGALPPLMAIVTNLQSPAGLRATTISDMRWLGSNAQPAVPLLIECLKDKDDEIAVNAADTLRVLRLEPEIVVGAFISNAIPGRTNVYIAIIHDLKEFGSNAHAAVPLLLKALRSDDKDVRSAAREALQRIDPNLDKYVLSPANL